MVKTREDLLKVSRAIANLEKLGVSRDIITKARSWLGKETKRILGHAP